MRKRRGTRKTAILAILIAVIGLSIGFAALNATLKITANTTLKGTNWSIIFQNVGSAEIVGDAREAAPAQIDENKTGLTLNVAFGPAPTETTMISYTFEVNNAGNVDAELFEDPTIDLGTLDGKVTATLFDITDSGNEQVTSGAKLAVGETRQYRIILQCVEATNESISTDDVSGEITVEFAYVQDTTGSGID